MGSKQGFDLAHEVLGSKVESKVIDVMDLSPETVGEWDVVLFSGVLYHVRDPLGSLQRVASVTRELLIVETHLDWRLRDRAPLMRFLPSGALDDDPTNQWAPNRACVEEMLVAVGFDRVAAYEDFAPDHSGLPFWRRWLANLGSRDGGLSWLDRLWQWRHGRRRMVFHARRDGPSESRAEV